jgi:MFS family permease
LIQENDPLWKLRHALAGMAIALLVSVFIAALLGRVLGDLFGDSYGLRVAIYAGLLAYVVAGTVVLFVKVARHETRPLTPGRVGLWLASLWLWPGLLLAARKPSEG